MIVSNVQGRISNWYMIFISRFEHHQKHPVNFMIAIIRPIVMMIVTKREKMKEKSVFTLIILGDDEIR